MDKPVIGITPGFRDEEHSLVLNKGYADALLAAGAVPVLLPLTEDPGVLQSCIELCDGFLFSGGPDIDPCLYDEMQLPDCGAISPLRDGMELALAKLLVARDDKPVLGICRGFQVLNVALGGDLYQDLPAQFPHQVLAHRQNQPAWYPSHDVVITMSSLLDMIIHASKIRVNSLHHQAVRRLGRDFVPCAVATDGVIEAAALEHHPFFLGVQWHPERTYQTDDASIALFRAFAEACSTD